MSPNQQIQKNHLLKALIEINRELAGVPELEVVLERILYIARDVCHYDNAIIRLLSDDKEHLVPAASYGYAPEALRQRVCVGQGVMGQVAQSGQPMLVSDIRQHPGYLFGIPGARSEIAVPLLVQQNVVGVLNIESPQEGAFKEHDLEALLTVAAQASLAIEKARMDESLRAVSARFRKLHALSDHILNSTNLGIFTLDQEHRITSWNLGMARLLECQEQEVMERHIEAVFPEMKQSGFCSKIDQVNHFSGEEKLILRRVSRDGTARHLETRVTALRGDGQHFGMVAIVEDISERVAAENQLRENEQRLNQLAFHDNLTHLPNRLMFTNRLRQAMEMAQRQDRRVGLLFLDLDHFKHINDSLGHRTGDEVLRAVASRMEASLRGRDLIARLGGDEFVVIVENFEQPEDLVAIARKILRILPAPIPAKGMNLHPTASIGIALFPQDGTSVESLMQSADVALYRAKEKGRNTFCFYNPAMNAQACNRLHLESNLRSALEQGQLSLHYQPQLELASGRLVGMEALVRWQHPEYGLVRPGHFIPLAEENGLILNIGEWVLRQACRQGRLWRDEGRAPMRMAVNISPRQFAQPGFAALVARVLEETGYDPAWLELEITETALMKNTKEADGVLQDLRAMGVSLAIDDFGTGFSSLSYLQRFPINRLKIDRSFVKCIGVGQDKSPLAPAIIALGRSLGLEILAEGIETRDQFLFLREQGCDLGQGYLIARPQPAEQAHGFHVPTLSSGDRALPASPFVIGDASSQALTLPSPLSGSVAPVAASQIPASAESARRELP